MDKITKEKIDDLLGLSITIKRMYQHLAYCDGYENELTEEEIEKRNNILLVIKDAIRIENQKVNDIEVTLENIESIEGYLIRFYHDLFISDMFYEDNHLERLRVFNKLCSKLNDQLLANGIDDTESNMSNSFAKAVDYNQVQVLQMLYEEAHESKSIYSYLKYAKIYVTSEYDEYYFNNNKVHDLVKLEEYFYTLESYDESFLDIYKKRYLDEGLEILINDFYQDYSNDALEYEEVEAESLTLITTFVAYLVSSLDLNYVEEKLEEYNNWNNHDPNYTDADSMINSAFLRSKYILENRKNITKKIRKD
jgi:hypothetical protein